MLDAALGLSVTLAAVLLAAVAIGTARVRPPLKLVLLAGLALRMVGAFTYLEIVAPSYGGGDFLQYVERGQGYAARLHAGDWTMFANRAEWWSGTWTGTQFVFFPTGIIAALFGPSVLMQFVVFSLLSFLGLLAFGVAFARVHPEIPTERYLRWLLLFPALWFWPAAPGKDALVLLGAGLAVLGYCGRAGRIGATPLIAGLALVFAVRPQVAMVLLAAIALGQWLGRDQGWSVRRVVEGVAIAAIAVIGLQFAARTLGMQGADVSDVRAYVEARGSTVRGVGSNITTGAATLRGLPLAVVNVWLRPFPWEAHSATSLLSALEILVLWSAIGVRRRRIRQALSGWRSDRMVRLVIPFLLLYSVGAGMTMWNLGIIARQRILLFPFLFVLMEAARVRRRVPTASASRVGPWLDGAPLVVAPAGTGASPLLDGRTGAHTEGER